MEPSAAEAPRHRHHGAWPSRSRDPAQVIRAGDPRPVPVHRGALPSQALARLCACLACEVLTRSGRTQRELLLLPPLTRLFGTAAGTPGRQYTAARTTTVVDIAMSTIISTAMSAAMSTVVYTVVDIVMVDIVMSTIIST
ncbi:unnamed protein product [Lampetra fluviatilis]